jgi:hypothetical protein
MSRLPAGNRIEVKPSNNVYTALAGTALLAVIAALVVLFVRAGEMNIKIF